MTLQFKLFEDFLTFHIFNTLQKQGWHLRVGATDYNETSFSIATPSLDEQSSQSKETRAGIFKKKDIKI